MIIDQPEGVEVDVQAQMAKLLEAEETLGEEEVLDEKEPIQQAEESEAEEVEDEVEEEPEEEPTEEIVYNGETKVLTKSELKQLAQQGFDYTQKTQSLAEQRRSFEAQQQALQVQLAIHSQLSDVAAEVKSLDNQISQYKNIDWAQLAESDPHEYLKYNHAYRELKDAREAKVNEYNAQYQQLSAAQQQTMQQVLQAEAKLLAQQVPEFSGDKSKDAKQAVAQYLAENGFSPQEIGSLMDHRMVKVAWEAAQYRKLKSSKPQIEKRVAEVPKVVKGKQPVNVKASENKAMRDRLARTGDGELAAKLIERML